MRKVLGGAALLAAVLAFAGAASAAPHHQWFINPAHNGRGLECDEDNDGAVAGPFPSRSACEAALGGGGGGGQGGEAASVADPGQGGASFLCYIAGGSLFVAAPGQAAELEAEGFWLPNAVAGTVAGGTNVGSYHLSCGERGTMGLDGNAPPATTYADNGGYVLDFAAAAATGWVGVYPIA